MHARRRRAERREFPALPPENSRFCREFPQRFRRKLFGASDLLVMGVPTFGWAEGHNFLVKSGPARRSLITCRRVRRTEDVMLVLRYFDAMNFAGMIRCATLIGLGLHDPVVPVESDVVVPVNEASDKVESAARTLRLKVQQLWPEHLHAVPKLALHNLQMRIAPPGLDWRKPKNLLRELRVDRTVDPVTEYFRGGTSEAEKIFRRFCGHELHDYKENRNQPQTNSVSHMSKYLHFGQISPVWLALEVRKHAAAGRQNVESFVDELLVRRELSMNWVEFNSRYADYESLPEWARATLTEHVRDRRPHIYSRAQLEAAETHDPYWNAAMREMRFTGYMHNHMRMYWGKKILEWTAAPADAHAIALAINNKYFLDGRDANSFANIAWIFGQHDRPWPERPVFGKVRYMNAAGLERKCDIGAYVAKVERLVARAKR